MCTFKNQASTIFSMQSPQRMLTVLVARMLCPHLGQMYLRVLDRLPGVFPPSWLPLSPALRPPLAGGVQVPPPRLMLISVQPWLMMYSSRASPGSVMVQPYLS